MLPQINSTEKKSLALILDLGPIITHSPKFQTSFPLKI